MNLKSPSRQLRPRSAIGSRSKLIDREEVADEEEDEEEEEDTRDDHDEAANHIEFYDEGLERSDFLFQEDFSREVIFPKDQANKLVGRRPSVLGTYLDSSRRESHFNQLNEQGVQDLFSDILFCQADDDGNGVVEEGQVNSGHCFPISPVQLNFAETSVSAFNPSSFEPFKSFEETLEDTQLRLLRRTTEAEVKSLHRPQSFSLAYPELQRSSGQRVLEGVRTRTERLEKEEEEQSRKFVNLHLSPNSSPQVSGKGQRTSEFLVKKRPPARLKPIEPNSQ